jgi:biopolymer transport protein ExbB/TolQ
MDVLGIVGIAVVVGFVGLVATAWWMRRLWTRRNELPWGTKTVAGIVGAAAIFGAVGTVIGIVKAFGAIGAESVDPSQKARMLAEAISEGMNMAGLGIIVWIPSVLVLLVLARKPAKR